MNRPRFRRAIDEVLRHADETRYRSDIHDAPAPAFPHRRNRRFATKKNALQVGVDDTVPILFARIVNAFEQGSARKHTTKYRARSPIIFPQLFFLFSTLW